MDERRVTQTGKDDDGDITKLCNPGSLWSPRYKDDAIKDIDNKVCEYFVQTGMNKTYVHVVNDSTKGKYLRTTADATSDDNLDNLPDCE